MPMYTLHDRLWTENISLEDTKYRNKKDKIPPSEAVFFAFLAISFCCSQKGFSEWEFCGTLKHGHPAERGARISKESRTAAFLKG